MEHKKGLRPIWTKTFFYGISDSMGTFFYYNGKRSGFGAGIGFSRYAQLLIGRDDVDHNRGSVTGNHRVSAGTAPVLLII